MKYIKWIIIVVLIILIFLSLKIFLKEDENIPDAPSNQTETTVDSRYLKNSTVNNHACIFNDLLRLMKCDNILEEKYDSKNNLIYIQTPDKEYYYNYIYKDGKIVKFSHENFEINVSYDEYGRIIQLDIINNGKNSKVIYEFPNYIEDDTLIPNKITLYEEEKMLYYLNIEKEIDFGSIYIVEKKYDSRNINLLTRTYYFEDNRNLSPTFFEQINYIPEPYYENNFFLNLKYIYANHGTELSNFYPQIENFDKIINDSKFIFYKTDNSFYNSNYDYLKILSNDLNCAGERYLNTILYKYDNKYYKYTINKNAYQNKPFYIINNPIEITYEEYHEYIKNYS